MNFRILIPLLLGLMLCATSIYAQDTLVVSERVGKVIDADEQRYFQLFPRLESTDGIVLRRAEFAGIRVDADGEAVLDLDFAQLGLLQEYIDGYDSLMQASRTYYVARNLNDRFGALLRAEAIAEITPWAGADIKVTAARGNVLSARGELLWADERRIIIHPEDAPANAAPVSIAAVDITSISSFDNDPGRGAAIGAGVGAGLGLVLGVLTAATLEEKEREFKLQFTIVAALTFVGAAAFAALGTLAGLLITFEEETEIDSPYQYLSILPSLQQIMNYRYGLPPDSPWREK